MNVAEAMQRHQEAKARRNEQLLDAARHPYMRKHDEVETKRRLGLKNRKKRL